MALNKGAEVTPWRRAIFSAKAAGCFGPHPRPEKQASPQPPSLIQEETQMHYGSKCRTQNYEIPTETGENLHALGFGNEFLNTTLKAQSMTEKVDKSDFIKIKASVFLKMLLRE